VILINELISLATLSFSTADVSVHLWPKTMRISGRLGSLALVNEDSRYNVMACFDQLMSIEGQNFADFAYQTYDPVEEKYNGIKSSISLNAASIKFHLVEKPLHDLYTFVHKLARLKGLYDAATQAAVQSASGIERMQFSVSIKSPIIIFPCSPTSSTDAFVLRLGQINANNKCEAVVNRITAGLQGIQLVSNLCRNGENCSLKVIDEIGISTDIVQTVGINRQTDVDLPDTQVFLSFLSQETQTLMKCQVAVKISDVKLRLTQIQYCLLMRLLNEIPRVFEVVSIESEQDSNTLQSASTSRTKTNEEPSNIALQPELTVTSQRSWTTFDLVVSIAVVKLHLYDPLAHSEQQLKEHGIVRFALNDSSLRYKTLSDGSGEAQVILKSFTMSNTRPGVNAFREIIPAAQHDRNQFMLLYTTANGPTSTSLAVLTVDSPKIILAVDPIISLLEFMSSPFAGHEQPLSQASSSRSPEPAKQGERSFDIRLDLHDVSVSILENDTDANSRAICLYVNQISLSQQVRMLMTIFRFSTKCISGHSSSDDQPSRNVSRENG
jgi:vacuolar protein sorting-associated protein 13A/C